MLPYAGWLEEVMAIKTTTTKWMYGFAFLPSLL
jgi:hypothetical protein